MSEIEEPTKEFQARKEFLLHQARRARMKFVLQARDPQIGSLPDKKSPKDLANGPNSTEESAGSTATATKLAQQQRNKVPAAECVQQVLDFFHHLLPEDAEAVDVDQLLLSVQDTDVEEDLRNFQATVGSGTQSDYDLFLRKLLLPQAAHIVKMLQQFVLKTQARYRNIQLLPTSAFGMSSNQTLKGSKASKNDTKNDSNTATGPLTAEEVWDFIDHVCQAMQETELWASGPSSTGQNAPLLTSAAALAQLSSNYNKNTTTSSTASTAAAPTLLPLDPSVEVFVERFVFRKIGDYLFAGDKDEARKNHLTAQRILALQFVTAEHLDIRSLQEKTLADILHLIAPASEALRQVTLRSSPSDKVACLRSCCQLIAQLLKRLKTERDASVSASASSSSAQKQAQQQQQQQNMSLPGADELLPMMIYVVLKTPLSELHSQIRFLQSYTRPRQMLSEAGYLVTQFVSAIYFLDNVDARALMIEPDAFDSAMFTAKQQAKTALQAQQLMHQHNLLAMKKQHPPQKHSTAGGGAGGAETLDLQSILSQYKAEMKLVEQSSSNNHYSSSSLDFNAHNNTHGNSNNNNSSSSSSSFMPSLREYRLQYQPLLQQSSPPTSTVDVVQRNKPIGK